MAGPQFLCELLAPEHRLDNFDCGAWRYDDWLKDTALKCQREHLSRVYAFTPVTEPKRVVGYFTLSNHILRREHLTNRFREHGFPEQPAILIGRLAADRSVNGMLKLIMSQALSLAVQASRLSAARFVVIDAEDEGLANLYERYGFARAKQVEGAATIRLIMQMRDLIDAS